MAVKSTTLAARFGKSCAAIGYKQYYQKCTNTNQSQAKTLMIISLALVS